MTASCPGNDTSKWRPEDIRFVLCLSCGNEVEIWKDEPVRICSGCGKPVRNPGFSLDCAHWCQSASECPGVQMKPSSEELPKAAE